MQKAKILVVDDSSIVLELVGSTLRDAGYEVITRAVAVGTTAAILRERPLLVLMDESMPLMTGAEVTAALRARPTKESWVLLHSDRPEAELRELAAACGADGWIRKTPDEAKLLAEVRAWVSRGRPEKRPPAPGRAGGYILAACKPELQTRLASELAAPMPMVFTHSGEEAIRLLSSKDAPSLAMIGTALSDVSYGVVYVAALRADPSYRKRCVILEEPDGPRAWRHAGELPTWSASRDAIAALGSTLAGLRERV